MMSKNRRLLVLAGFIVFPLFRDVTRAQEPVTITPDRPDSVQQGIEAAYQTGLRKIVIPPGVYRLSCPRGTDAVMGSAFHLDFHGLKHFEIDAQGVTFIATTRDVPSIQFLRCEDVVLKGATFVHETPPFSQGKVIAFSPKFDYVDVRVDAGYPTDIDDSRFFGNRVPVIDIYDRQTYIFKKNIPDIYIKPPIKLSAGIFRFPFRFTYKVPITIGDRVSWRGWGFSDIVLILCQNVKLQDVTIKAAPMQGLCDTFGVSNIYENVKITYGPPPQGATDKPLLSANADGFIFARGFKGPTLENCTVEGVDDDGIAIHGIYSLGISSEGNKVTLAQLPILQFDSGMHLGDKLRFYNTAGTFSGEAQVTDIKHLPHYSIPQDLTTSSLPFADPKQTEFLQVTLDQPVPAQFNWLIADANELGSGFVIRNCTVRTIRNAGMRIRADDGIIEGCTVENVMYQGILLTTEHTAFPEGDFCRDVEIRNNTLRNVDLSHDQSPGLEVAANDYTTWPPLPGGHRNIVIENNTFDNIDNVNILVASAEEVTISGNRFQSPLMSSPPPASTMSVDNGSLVYLSQVRDVQLSENKVMNAGPGLSRLIKSDDTVSGTGLSNGIAKVGP
jgi:hypothetical protein